MRSLTRPQPQLPLHGKRVPQPVRLAAALLDLVCRELACIASKPDQRRMYMRELPHLFRLLRLAVCSHLQQLIESVLHLVKVLRIPIADGARTCVLKSTRFFRWR